MAEVINLRQARKARARGAAAQAAAESRALHGRTKAECHHEQAEAERAAKLLAGAKREGND